MKKRRIGSVLFLIVAAVAVWYIRNPSLFSSSDPASSSPASDPAALIERFGDIPADLYEHVYLSSRAQGSCARLCSTVTVTAVFVNDQQYSFSEAEKQQYRQDFAELLERIEQDASSFGADVQLQAVFHSVDSTVPLVRNDCEPWVDQVYSLVGITDPSGGNMELEQRYGVQEAPVVMITKQQGRSFAQSSSAKNGREYIVLYNDFDAMYHELLHLFGARDFYYPEWVAQLARTLLAESIMISNDGQVDPLTAYLVGWTDTLAAQAQDFLEQSASLTGEQLTQAHEEETFTGYVTDRPYGNGRYTGYLVDGVRHGEGVYTNSDGVVYSGTFAYGALHGYGECRYPDGSGYVGNWADGQLHGYGEYRYENGNVYKGDWVNGIKQGNGTYTWADGTVYTGAFKNDTRTGKGVMTWQSGARYEGDFVNGERQGYGTYSWPNGDRFVGEWKNGERHGEGTYTWADGTTRSGRWKNGKFVG